MLRRSLSEENRKDLAEQGRGEGQARVVWMKTRSLEMTQKTAGGGESLAESRDERQGSA